MFYIHIEFSETNIIISRFSGAGQSPGHVEIKVKKKKKIFICIWSYFRPNSKIQIMTKLKIWQNSRNQTGSKLENSNCDKTQKLKLWQNSNTKILLNSKLEFDQNLKI